LEGERLLQVSRGHQGEAEGLVAGREECGRGRQEEDEVGVGVRLLVERGEEERLLEDEGLGQGEEEKWHGTWGRAWLRDWV